MEVPPLLHSAALGIYVNILRLSKLHRPLGKDKRHLFLFNKENDKGVVSFKLINRLIYLDEITSPESQLVTCQ
jgi:hypothetical protein